MQNPTPETITSDTPEIDSVSIPIEEQTTVRIAKALHDKLLMISVIEQRTLFSVVQSMISDYCRRYESATGRSLSIPKSKPPRP